MDDVVHTPGTCGGRARINGTMIPVFVVELMRRSGMSLEGIRRGFPHVSVSLLGSAVKYARENRAEIDADIAAGSEG